MTIAIDTVKGAYFCYQGGLGRMGEAPHKGRIKKEKYTIASLEYHFRFTELFPSIPEFRYRQYKKQSKEFVITLALLVLAGSSESRTIRRTKGHPY
jgi:hypothetical protein